MQKNPERITVRIEVVAECGTVSISEHSATKSTMEEAASLMGYCFRAVDNFLIPCKIDEVTAAFENSAFQETWNVMTGH